jgi:hypothetical protein
MAPWRNWYHCIGSTYGSWVRGDQRGWRARHHREHVEGDYKDPPPEGAYDAMRAHSHRLMKRERIILTSQQRQWACEALMEALLHYNVQVVDLAVSALHYHVLARFTAVAESGGVPGTGVPGRCATGVAGLCEAHYLKDGRDPVPRYVLGKAHSWCSRIVRQRMRQSPGTPVPGIPAGGLWATRPRVIPVVNRAHQIRVAGYIRDHIAQGAAVWSLMGEGSV